MPRTIPEGFEDFHNKLKIKKTESLIIANHRQSVKDCLESNFNLRFFFRSGSIGNGTNINGFSDTDYFACIPRNKLSNNSNTSLVKIKEALVRRFPRTNIRIDSPAVVLKFGTVPSETTEIIPADYMKQEDGYNVYEIPDGNSSWITSSPKASNQYVTDENIRLNYRVKPLIRLIKALKFYNNIPISSFYLEMRVAKYASTQGSISYLIDIECILRYLINIDLANIINPSGIGGYVHACKSDSYKATSLSKLNTAHRRISEAIESKNLGRTKEAFDWLDLAFNGKFPSYY